MNLQSLLPNLMGWIPLVLSLTVHEWAHARSAKWLGDDTAEREGRLTLNPIDHIDLIGTVILPLLLPMFAGGFAFGWAKPVPVNPVRFRRDISMRTGMMITAAAGPVSNVVLAILCAVLFGLLVRFNPSFHQAEGLGLLLQMAMQTNVALALFNMLPVYPLDGSRVLDGFVPYRLRTYWEAYLASSWSRIGLMVVMLMGGFIIAIPVGIIGKVLLGLARIVAGV